MELNSLVNYLQTTDGLTKNNPINFGMTLS